MFQIIGDEIHFSGYRVAVLTKDAHPTLRAKIERMLEEIEDREEYDRGYEDGVKDGRADR